MNIKYDKTVSASLQKTITKRLKEIIGDGKPLHFLDEITSEIINNGCFITSLSTGEGNNLILDIVKYNK